jgi:hypothetical protein
MVHGIALADVLAVGANDDAELDLPVDLLVLADGWHRDDRARGGECRLRLEELDGEGRVGQTKLLGVRLVAEAGAANRARFGSREGAQQLSSRGEVRNQLRTGRARGSGVGRGALTSASVRMQLRSVRADWSQACSASILKRRISAPSRAARPTARVYRLELRSAAAVGRHDDGRRDRPSSSGSTGSPKWIAPSSAATKRTRRFQVCSER